MKTGIRGLLIVFTLLFFGTTVQGSTTKQVDQYLSETASFLMSHNPKPSMGSVGGEWMIMGLARSERLRTAYGQTYEKQLASVVNECKGKLSERKYTEYSRVIIALTSIGQNPEKFQGYNLLRPLAELDGIKRQGANGIIYALISLDCGNYEIPKPDGSYHGEITTREKLVEFILAAELPDGGWAFSGKKADSDMTAMTIQALVPYYKKDDAVKKAVHKGLECLSQLQLPDGSYQTGPTKTCESTAQVLTALSEMGISINDKRFVKNGNTVFDGLLTYYHHGSFSHLPGGDINEMATEQAFYAMAALSRNLSGKNRLYEMSDARKLEEATDSANASIVPGKGSEKKSRNKKKVVNEKEAETQLGEEVTSTETKQVETTKSGPKKKKTALKKEKEAVSDVDVTKSVEKINSTKRDRSVLKKQEDQSEVKKVSVVPYVIGGIFILFLGGGICFYQKKQNRS